MHPLVGGAFEVVPLNPKSERGTLTEGIRDPKPEVQNLRQGLFRVQTTTRERFCVFVSLVNLVVALSYIYI
jgi:hypothetical protein